MNIYEARYKELRKEKGWSQEDLAGKMGTGTKRETLSQYETGKTKPDADTLIAMADAFGVSVDYLLGRANCEDISAEEVHRRTGLSEKAVRRLTEGKTYTKETCASFVNMLLEYEYFDEIMNAFSDYRHWFFNPEEYLEEAVRYENAIRSLENPLTYNLKAMTNAGNYLLFSLQKAIIDFCEDGMYGEEGGENYNGASNKKGR